MLSLSAVLVFLGLEFVLIWKGGLKLWHAGVCNIAALYLAATSIGPSLYGGLASATHMLSQIHL